MLLIEPSSCRGHLVHYSYFRAELFRDQIGSEVSAYKPSPWEGRGGRIKYTTALSQIHTEQKVLES